MFFDLIKKRRSIRKFKEKLVEEDKIKLLKQAMLLAPSSKGRNPWEFILVDQRELLLKLSESKPHGSAFLAHTPLAIVIIANPNRSDVWIEDASIATTYILLAAEALKLGACWIQIRKRKYSDTIDAEEYIKNLLSIPGDRRILSIVGIGYPDETKIPRKAEDLEDNRIFFNQYGNYQRIS
ncbi:MAG: nitroreductase family protein [Candidatus Caldatribacteriota bacterium]